MTTTEKTPRKQGRTSKLTPEIQERAARILRETGQDKFAYSAINISRALFYRWKRENPEFKAAMDLARKDFDEGKFESASAEIAQAKAWLLKCLAGEQYQVTVTERKRRVRTERQNNDEVEVVSETEDWIIETETKRVQVLPPSWYLERLYTGGEQKTELTVRIGVAKPQPRTDDAIEADLSSYDDEQDSYEYFDRDDGDEHGP